MPVRKSLSIIAVIIGLLAGAAAVAVWLGWNAMHEPYTGYSEPEQFVVIRQGASSPEIGRQLAAAHVVRDPRLFRTALWWTGRGRSLKAGEYRFDHPLTPLEVVDVLVRGEVYTVRLTVPEGLNIEEVAKLYESHGFGSAGDFVQAARNVGRIHDFDDKASDLEGYLFPETYALPRHTPASRLIDLMVERFRTVYDEKMRARGSGQGLTTRQVVTLASLVEKETGKAEERPIVAAVYRNRMKIGMPMQADPTIVYALEKAHRYDGNIRREDLSMDSPYNTYKYAGLPPGPIASAGKAALEAVLMPSDVPYLYFVSRNDGSHVFAQTLAEHDANVRKFQVDFFRKQRQAEKSSARPTSASRAAARSSRARVP
jgi:peptidoglycan lytic transglycosylase G